MIQDRDISIVFLFKFSLSILRKKIVSNFCINYFYLYIKYFATHIFIFTAFYFISEFLFFASFCIYQFLPHIIHQPIFEYLKQSIHLSIIAKYWISSDKNINQIKNFALTTLQNLIKIAVFCSIIVITRCGSY